MLRQEAEVRGLRRGCEARVQRVLHLLRFNCLRLPLRLLQLIEDVLTSLKTAYCVTEKYSPTDLI